MQNPPNSLFLLLLIFVVSFIGLDATTRSSRSSCNADTSYKMFGSATDYSQVGNATNFAEYLMSQCSPVGLWNLNRHGARYPSLGEMNEMNKWLPQLRDFITSWQNPSTSNDDDWVCNNDTEIISIWDSPFSDQSVVQMQMQLTARGRKQMRDFGYRMRLRLQSWMETLERRGEHLTRTNIVGTCKVRTRQSAEELTKGLFSPFVTQPPVKFPADCEQPDYLVSFLDHCDKYKQQVKNNATQCWESSEFEAQSVRLKLARDRFVSRLANNLPTTTSYETKMKMYEQVYRICQYRHLLDSTTSIWCKLLDQDMLEVDEYLQDIKNNCKYGYKHEITQLATCDLMGNLVETFRQLGSTSNSKTNLTPLISSFFGYSSTTLPFFASLGIGQSSKNFNLDNITAENVDRKYRSSRMDPMSGNLALILFKCDESDSGLSDYKIRAFLNENQIQLKGCTTMDCNLSEFLAFYSKIVNECGSTESACSVDL